MMTEATVTALLAKLHVLDASTWLALTISQMISVPRGSTKILCDNDGNSVPESQSIAIVDRHIIIALERGGAPAILDFGH